MVGKYSYPGEPDKIYEAMYTSLPQDYYGATAAIRVYNPTVKKGQSSIASVWVQSGLGTSDDYNFVQAGWHIEPRTYGDNKPHFVVHWKTSSDYTGFINSSRPEFVLADHPIIKPGAIINRKTSEIVVKIEKDIIIGNWWLYYAAHKGIGDKGTLGKVGYWPRHIFTTLADKATNISFGGMVLAEDNSGPTPGMGNGRLPPNKQAALFTSVRLANVNAIYNSGKSTDFVPVVLAPDCYNVGEFDSGTFQYGGPPGCDK